MAGRAAENPLDGSPPSQGTQASSTRVRTDWPLQREINFSSNAPVPVDVAPGDQGRATPQADSPATPAKGRPTQPTGSLAPPPARPIDDYWIRQPSDRKWGTLTLAASKLAERRANARREQPAQAEAQRSDANEHPVGLLTTVASARTLPRSFKSGPLLPRRPPRDTNQIISRAGGAESSAGLRPPPLPPHGPKVAPRATRLAIGPGRPQVGPQSAHNTGKLEQAPLAGLSFAAAAAAQHRRSISQIEARQAWQEESSLVAQQQPGGCQWLPASNWTQQDLTDFASMSFGPPAEAALGGLDWSLMWPHANDSLDAVRAPAGWQLSRQPQFEQFPASRQPLGARNSLARSTLPLMAPTQANFGPSVLAPPYNLAHDLSQQQQQPVGPMSGQQQNIALCPFYPQFLLPSGPPLDYGQQQAQQMAPMSQHHQIRDNDDPLTENACLGSYRRKRRLPHIEAQFTIIKAPELPPKSSRNRLVDEQLDAADALAMQAPSRPSESGSLRRGQLFVRDVPVKPAGLPQPGQRAEQRRLRDASAAELNLGRIGARDKVEVYLRHQQVAAAKRAPPPPPPQASPRPSAGSPPADSFSSSSSVELSQVNELTFQPYYNLPSLKYTISLPLKSGHGGCLTLKKSASLRPVKSGLRQRSRTNSQAPGGEQRRRLSCMDDAKADNSSPDLASDKDQLRALNVEPPPIPPHRRLVGQQQQRTQVGPTRSNESQQSRASANLTSGSSPSSSVVSSASSSGASDETMNTANTDTGIDRSRSTATQAGERAPKAHDQLRDLHEMHDDQLHSADENYEFDQVSSCSSSRVRRRVKRRSRSAGRLADTKEACRAAVQACQQQLAIRPQVGAVASSEPIYTQVEKRQSEKRRRVDDLALESLERSNFYDCSRLKEQKLTCDNMRPEVAAEDGTSNGEVTLTNENVAHFYDTVCESLEQR